MSGSYSGATGAISEVGFYYGTTSGSLATKVTAIGTPSPFNKALTGLAASTTYYYKAYVVEYNESTSSNEYRYGEERSFTTAAMPLPQYLKCNEIPAVSLSNPATYTSTGTETFGSTKWYEYDTSTSTRKIVTHTYSYNGDVYRNYTAMVDQTKRCALWTAYPMHATAYPNNSVTRGEFSESKSYDPAIPPSWQSSGSTSDYNNGNGYARGHHCASEDRQACRDANDQTFYYTNQSPQWQNSFNSGIWSNLESAVQSHAPTGRDTLYVVVGTLFENGNTGPSNDGGTVARPSHFYKLLMKCSFDGSGTMTAASGVAYLYTNEAHSNCTYNDSTFRTTIDAIETRTGFDFFANVPAALQTAAEAQSASLW